MNSRKWSWLLVLAILIVVIGAAWYYGGHQPPSQSQPTNPSSNPGVVGTSTSQQGTIPLRFSFSCPQATTTAYENSEMGIAFCYPSDLTVTTNSISWPNGSGTGTSHISFWILYEPSAMTLVTNLQGSPKLFYDLADCDASGSNGEDYCVFPTSTQITAGENQNGFNYVLFRHDVVNNRASNVLNSAGGPSAFIPLIGQNYLVYAEIGSLALHDPNGFVALPSSVDKDLLEILNTVAVMPQKYTGVGLTLADATSGITIYNVIKNSPAAAAGIMAGENIVGINGTSTSNMTADDLSSLFAKTTSTVNLSIEHGSEEPVSISLTAQTFWVSGSDLGATYEKPF